MGNRLFFYRFLLDQLCYGIIYPGKRQGVEKGDRGTGEEHLLGGSLGSWQGKICSRGQRASL